VVIISVQAAQPVIEVPSFFHARGQLSCKNFSSSPLLAVDQVQYTKRRRCHSRIICKDGLLG